MFVRELLMSTNPNVTIDQMVFRKTHGHTGRRISITPSNSTMQHLAYGRIILNPTKSTEAFSTGERETGLIVLSGQDNQTGLPLPGGECLGGLGWVQNNPAIGQMLHGAVAGRDGNTTSSVSVRLAENHLIDCDVRVRAH